MEIVYWSSKPVFDAPKPIKALDTFGNVVTTNNYHYEGIDIMFDEPLLLTEPNKDEG